MSTKLVEINNVTEKYSPMDVNPKCNKNLSAFASLRWHNLEQQETRT